MMLSFYAPAMAEELPCNSVALVIDGLAAQKGNGNSLNTIQIRAEDGDALAQTQLAGLYYWGKVVKQDGALSAKWYLAAAKQGFAPAQNNISRAYAVGIGIEKSYEDAHKWVYEAAKQGFPNAQWNLAMDYYLGIGVSVSNKESFFWASLAARTDPKYVKGRDKFADTLSPEDIVMVEINVRKWKVSPPSSTISFRKLESDIAEITGDLTEEQLSSSLPKLIEHLKNRAQQEEACSQNTLGNLLYEGSLGQAQNRAEAIQWWRKAAKQGNLPARSNLRLKGSE